VSAAAAAVAVAVAVVVMVGWEAWYLAGRTPSTLLWDQASRPTPLVASTPPSVTAASAGAAGRKRRVCGASARCLASLEAPALWAIGCTTLAVPALPKVTNRGGRSKAAGCATRSGGAALPPRAQWEEAAVRPRGAAHYYPLGPRHREVEATDACGLSPSHRPVGQPLCRGPRTAATASPLPRRYLL
jgi:hypothetical protein